MDKAKGDIEEVIKKLKKRVRDDVDSRGKKSSPRKKDTPHLEEENTRPSNSTQSSTQSKKTEKAVSGKADGSKNKDHAIMVDSSDSDTEIQGKGTYDLENSTQSDDSDESDSMGVELVLLNTPSVEQSEIEEFIGCDVMHFECVGRAEEKRPNVAKFSVRNIRVAKRARRRVEKKNSSADLQFYQGVTYERLRSILVSGWNPQHMTDWSGLLEDIKSVLLRRNPELIVIDVNVFPGKAFGNVTLRDVSMAENFIPFKANFVGVEFSFKARDNLVIKGFAEGVIDGLQLQDMDQVRNFLEEEVGDLARFEAIKKGAKTIVIFGFDDYVKSERVVEGEVMLKVPRREVKGGYVVPKVFWAKQYIANPPSNKKEAESPSKSKDGERAIDTVSSNRLLALDKQRAEDYRNVREEMERGLKEQTERTIDLINHQGKETTRTFSNTMVTMNQRNYEVMILMQEVNRIERKLALAETSVTLYHAMQNENLDKLIPGIESSIGKLEEELKAAEAELKAANGKPLDIPEYTPINKTSLMIGCANDDSPAKKYEKPVSRNKRKATKKSDNDSIDEDDAEGDLVDQTAVRKWSAVISGKDAGFHGFAAKAMWARDVESLLTRDLAEDKTKVVTVIGTLAAFMKVFGNDCKEGKLAEKKIDELILLL